MELSFSCFNLVIYKKAQYDKNKNNRDTREDKNSNFFESKWDFRYLFRKYYIIVMRIFAS